MPSSHSVLADAQDSFDNLVTDRTNVLDLAAHYPYSSERWRLSVDGTRVFPEYNAVAQYTHAEDTHDLSPAAGETVTLESAERPRYVVQYEMATTWAFGVNQSLQGDDYIRIGLYDGTDGWYLEHNGGHSDTEADLVCERAGSEVYREGPVDIYRSVQAFARLKLRTGWYRVTRQAWERSYSDDGAQRNRKIDDVSADDAEGPRTGNLPVHFEVSADASTTDLVLSAGSAAQVNLGTTTAFNRQKTATFTASIGTADTWVPLHAFRVDLEREIINTQLVNTDIVGFSGSGDVRVMPVAVAASKVADGTGAALTDSDFATPTEQSASNSVIEATGAVGEFPDSTGAVTTSAADPGGYQLGFSSAYTSGTGSKTQVRSGGETQKRGINGGDICVFLGYAGVSGDVTVEYITEQQF